MIITNFLRLKPATTLLVISPTIYILIKVYKPIETLNNTIPTKIIIKLKPNTTVPKSRE